MLVNLCHNKIKYEEKLCLINSKRKQPIGETFIAKLVRKPSPIMRKIKLNQDDAILVSFDFSFTFWSSHMGSSQPQDDPDEPRLPGSQELRFASSESVE